MNKVMFEAMVAQHTPSMPNYQWYISSQQAKEWNRTVIIHRIFAAIV